MSSFNSLIWKIINHTHVIVCLRNQQWKDGDVLAETYNCRLCRVPSRLRGITYIKNSTCYICENCHRYNNPSHMLGKEILSYKIKETKNSEDDRKCFECTKRFSYGWYMTNHEFICDVCVKKYI
jgi:hypothetical protein